MLKKSRFLFFLEVLICNAFCYAYILGDGTDISQKSFIYITDDIKEIYSFANTTLMLKNDGRLFGCGLNSSGELKENKRPIKTPELIENDVISCCAHYDAILYVKKNGDLYFVGNIPNSYDNNGRLIKKQTETPVLIDSNVRKVYSSEYSYFYIKEDNSLWNFGYNYNGVLGDGTVNHRYEPRQVFSNVKEVTSAIKKFFVLTFDGKVYELGIENKLVFENVKIINGPFIITMDNDLYGIGYNIYSALGLAEKKFFSDYQFIMKDVLWADGNGSHSLIVNLNNELFTCGGGNIYDFINATGDEKEHVRPDKIMDDVIYVSVGKGNQTSFVIKKDNKMWACGQNNANDINGL